ncbi:flavodoxin-dependent (E)-4-hydroxy-3-methylbut-2-enyl-diphosphate synthase [Porticoccaceae bacterium]|nr:flavodoxin-dependent (E)-4-hydroxy-3-methylbut-2-enyl-diphosphate synthase [Porticoccaceae bacterium]MDA8597476.1 flavodoxin-dependent (E)-4-hydroxy-3-methylbut-2-enyl-diphosphate synthase [Porticoccaceae bacterium]MDA8941927.1 flavodoxin-dependent (E)-4-hydroxy-3-methylbut-2-enyl-diphosphate synthase [Porticoccaceae bacterium]MDB2395707.1 flavodoxin-dependent (E)-4-hydroxy-3-methylbut-2-enyl-diphosphate synthase [Porticoccaceae bacterium]MDB2400586.1 flavodoxin-dependent (E)-4-hydroxy-3-met
MSFSESPIVRRKSRQIMVGDVPVGGEAPISVQSMTNTPTSDVEATVAQIESIQQAGADIVRVSVPSLAEAEAFGEIRKRVTVPLVADIHFDHKIALRVADLGVDCLRINPGNISREDRLREVITKAKDLNIPIRIGVNAGSLGKDLLRKYSEPTAEAMVESAMRNVELLDKYDFQNFKVSVKASEIFMAQAAYRDLAKRIEQPLHLGITEAGGLRSGTVKSAIGLGALLLDGIGDTVRISLAADPAEEARVAWSMLRSLRLRTKGINFIACPSCSRQNFDVISTVNALEARLEDITVPMDVSIIGCIVNGPGEAKISDFGLTGGTPANLVYLDGVPDHKISQENLVDQLEAEIRVKAATKQAQLAVEAEQIIAKG